MKSRNLLLAALTIVTVVAFTVGVALNTEAGALRRLSAEFKFFFSPPDPSECTTTADSFSGGVLCYSKTVATRPGEGVLFITVSTTGDTHNGAALLLGCFINGVPCNAGTTGAAQPKAPGYIYLRKLPVTDGTNCNDGAGGTADCHDNSIAYTWCSRVAPRSTHTVDIRLANNDNVSSVFIEQLHVYIDTVKGLALGGDRCEQG